MSGTGLALKIGSLVLGLGILIVLFKRVKSLKKFGWIGFFYILVLSLLLSTSTLFLFFSGSVGKFSLLLFGQLLILVFGILHVSVSKKIVPWIYEQPFSVQLIFLIALLLFGYFFSNISLTFLVTAELPLIWHLSLLWFLVPVLLDQSIQKLLLVPEKQFKTWVYPVSENIEDPSDDELESPVVISFVFRKNIDSELTTFRAKAPVGMPLGRLFYFFINDYNSRNPESPIAFIDEGNNPVPWTFFKVKNKLLKLREPLDPDESIYNNNIKENDILICHKSNIIKENSTDESIE